MRVNQNMDPRLSMDISAADASEANQTRTEQYNVDIVRSAYSLFSIFKVLFADGIFSFEDRRESQALFLGKGAKWAFKVIEIELSFVYDRLYTKASVSRTKLGKIIRVASLLLTLAGSLNTLFVTRHANQYGQRHRCVTYTLLVATVLTEATILVRYIYSVWSLVGSDWLTCWSANLVNRRRWSGYMAQSNLITFCLKKMPSDWRLNIFFVAFRPPRPRGSPGTVVEDIAQLLASLLIAVLYSHPLQGAAPQVYGDQALGAAVSRYLKRPSMLKQLQSKRFWKKLKNTRYILVQDELKAFIFEQVKEKEGIFIQQEGQYQATGIPDLCKPFIDCRGDWVLEKEGVDDCLGWTFQGKDFDESLLLWHIGTDLCFRHEVNQENDMIDQQVHKHTEIGMELSNYMLYIMVVHPLMLSSSTIMTIKRCRDTCAEARRHILQEHIQKFSSKDAISEENAHTSLLKVETTLRASAVKGDKSKSVLWDGCFLAKKLNQMPDRDKKWRVIARVWVEMLCYAAVQCGGYQHAERLKEGGELITFVCLLMTHLGMGKHYRTEVGDAYAHLSPFTAQLASRPAPHGPAQAQGMQQDAAISTDEASSSGHGQQDAATSTDEASTSGQ